MPFVQKIKQGEVVDIYKTDAMNLEIQTTMEQQFDLSMSTPITMTSLRDRLGFLSDTKFAMQMLRGELHIPLDIDVTTTLVLEDSMSVWHPSGWPYRKYTGSRGLPILLAMRPGENVLIDIGNTLWAL
jgi:hypothetical protein